MACAVPDSDQHLTLPSNLGIYKPTILEVSYLTCLKKLLCTRLSW